MCGIFGAFDTAGYFSGKDRDRFVALTDMVAHRGPDAAAYETLVAKTEAAISAGVFDIFLGHRRLSIIDLSSASDQPMTDGQGRWIVFNGEIFNYLELRQELIDRGHVFKTNSDTEVVLHVYAEYGVEGFDRFNGMWAFALVDIPERRVVLSRDRFSIKPLYYAHCGSRWYFGSEIKQLLPLLPGITINRDVAGAYFLQALLDHTNETFVTGIHKIPPKTTLVASLENGEVREHQYWDYGERVATSFDDAAEQFRELFLDSIRIRLRSDVKVGCLLSGGLDSSAIAVIANELTAGNMESYSVVSDDAAFSEEPYVDVVLRATGMPNRKVMFRPDDALGALETAAWHSDEPYCGLSVIAQYKMMETIRQSTDATVLLSGQGADEILLGYLKFFFLNIKSLVRDGHYFEAAREMFRSWANGTAVHQFRLAEARRYMPWTATRAYAGALMVNTDAAAIWESRDMRARQIEDIDHYSVPALAHYEDRNSMAHSLEVRHPFLDHRLVNFVVNLPTSYKLRDGWTKYLLRVAATKLPHEIRWRRDKQGFTTPEERWLREDLRPQIESLFRRSILTEMGLLDGRKFLNYYSDFISGKPIFYGDISRALVAEVWARRMLQPASLPEREAAAVY